MKIKNPFLILFIASMAFWPLVLSAGDMDQAIVHYNRGYDYYKKGEYDKAIEELNKSLEFDTKNENAFYGLGNCYYRKQSYEKAVDGYKKAIEINPDFSNAHYGLGTAYSALRMTDEADKEFTLYRRLKTGTAQGSTVSGGKSSSKSKSKSKTSKSSSKSASKSSSRPRETKQSGSSIKSGQGSSAISSFKNLAPRKKIKEILSVPKIKAPREYARVFSEVWSNSHIGKIFVGIIGYIGVTQIWLVLIAFQGLILWRIKKKRERLN